MKNKIVAVSGGMDILTNGHVRLILDAIQYGDVVVILNSDDWLIRKKGFYAFNWNERREILMSIKGVVDVIAVDDSDGTVCEALKRLRPDYFANGGDRKSENTPELKLCQELGIIPVFGVGGDKINSSSEITKKCQMNKL